MSCLRDLLLSRWDSKLRDDGEIAPEGGLNDLTELSLIESGLANPSHLVLCGHESSTDVGIV